MLSIFLTGISGQLAAVITYHHVNSLLKKNRNCVPPNVSLEPVQVFLLKEFPFRIMFSAVLMKMFRIGPDLAVQEPCGNCDVRLATFR